MYLFLLFLIYLAFVTLGLPDALLGSAWPVMYPAFKVPVSYAGIVMMIITGCTIISSLYTNRLVGRYGTGLVTAVSALVTGAALCGFSLSNNFWLLCLWAVPCGLGAGAVDAALNNFVALHYAAKHMNWLHCFWGVGASVGPYIMGYCLTVNHSWQRGYAIVGLIQVLLAVVLFGSLPVWRRKEQKQEGLNTVSKPVRLREAWRISGVKQVLLAFFSYCALETTTGLWASSYLVLQRGIGAAVAAKWVSLFYLGITFGRFLSGFVADRVGNRMMIRSGLVIIAVGLLVMVLPGLSDLASLAGLLLTGLGCAPIYPAIIHETPRNFGVENSQTIIGLQMACAYTGSALMPPVFGFLANLFSIALYPIYLGLFLVLMLIMTERLNQRLNQKQ
ncbi:MAG TPA: MFS transporter [Bacillota bacterium]|nr:MFS transporter [Bacillota bacterium]HPT68038.1 MFS transporter [Bacillota bacterium]